MGEEEREEEEEEEEVRARSAGKAPIAKKSWRSVTYIHIHAVTDYTMKEKEKKKFSIFTQNTPLFLLM